MFCQCAWEDVLGLSKSPGPPGLEQGLSLVAACGLLIAAASLVAEHRF